MIDEILAEAGGSVVGHAVVRTLGGTWSSLFRSSISEHAIPHICKTAAASARFDMLATWTYDMPEFSKTIKFIVEHYQANVRILLLSPDSPFLLARAEALGYTGDATAHSRSNIEDIRNLMRLLPSGRFQARLYNRLPTVAMFGTDKHVIATWLLEGLNFRSGPAVTLKRSDKIAEPLIKHFESIWSLETNQIVAP